MWTQLVRELGRRRWFYLAVITYATAVLVISAAASQVHQFQPLMYASVFLPWAGVFLPLALTAYMMPALWTKNPSSRLSALRSALLTPSFVAGLLTLAALFLAQGTFNSAKAVLPHLAPFSMDPLFAKVDHALFLGHDPWRLLKVFDPFTPVIQLIYMRAWMLLYVIFAISAAFPANRMLGQQYLWTLLLCLIVLGNAIAFIGLSGGPIFYHLLTGDSRFDPLVQHIKEYTGYGSTANLSNFLWQSYSSGSTVVGGGISAFPSMHVSLATLFYLMARKLDRTLGYVLLGFLVFFQIASIHLGWHYAVDGIASIIGTAVIWRSVGALLRRAPAQSPLVTSPA